MAKEAQASIKINKLLESAGWRFFDDATGKANVVLEPHVKLTQAQVDAMGNDFDATSNGFIDFLLLDENGFPLVVLEAKAESKNPLIGKEQARKYAKAQNCRFVILSNGIKPGVTVQSFHSGYFKSYPLPLPELETQRAIVAEIETEQALVSSNRELIRHMEAKVKAAIDRVWGGSAKPA